MHGVDGAALLLGFAVLLFSLSVHESAHALVAKWLGDPTGHLEGRISLNPIRHVDPVGTILLPLVLLWTTNGEFSFGYAKPVRYQPFLLRNPFLGSAAVSGAGPASNFALAVVAAAVLAVASPGGELRGTLGHEVFLRLLFMNVALGVFNLFPVPPLDGAGVVAGVLPRRAAIAWGRLEALGPLLFVLLLVTGTIGRVVMPVTGAIVGWLVDLAASVRG